MVALILALAAAQEAPVTLRLLDADGAPRSGPHEVSVALYDAADATEPLAAARYAAVLADGFVSVPLPPWPEARVEAWLELAVDGVVLGARERVMPLPVARVIERVPALAAPPGPCAEDSRGRIYLDTVAGALRVCERPPEWSTYD